jgi:hypothetical protein
MLISNPARGLLFREAARPVLERELRVTLEPEVSLLIGNPPKPHKFDLVADDRSWILECKALAWRENGGVPQAKITSITEAAVCLRDFQSVKSRRVVVMNRATHAKRRETLAEYYARLHSHNLAGVVALAEVDVDKGVLVWLVRTAG